MIRRSTPLAGLLLLLGAGSALALKPQLPPGGGGGGGGGTPAPAPRDLEVVTPYTVSVAPGAYGFNARIKSPSGQHLAAGLSVGAFQQVVNGVPLFLRTGVTDAQGRVRLNGLPGSGLQLLVSTHSARVSTVSEVRLPFGNVFQLPARYGASCPPRVTSFAAAPPSELVHAVLAQDALHRGADLADQVLGRPFAPFKAIYGLPGAGTHLRREQGEIVIGDRPFDQHPELLLDVVGVLVWYRAGLPVLTDAHTPTHASSSPAVALASGFGHWFAALAGDAIAPAAGCSADHSGVDFGGEAHYGRTPYEGDPVPTTAYPAYGDRNELNVVAALWDLTDAEVDGLGVVPGLMDRAAGRGALEGRVILALAAQLFRPVLVVVRRVLGRPIYGLEYPNGLPALGTLWERSLRDLYGPDGEEALRLNGVLGAPPVSGLTIDSPAADETVNSEDAQARGRAQGAVRVEVRLDGGAWRVARLSGSNWSADLLLRKGGNLLEVRAISAAGAVAGPVSRLIRCVPLGGGGGGGGPRKP